MVNTRSTTSKLKEKEELEAKLQLVTGAQEMPPPTPVKKKNDEPKVQSSCAASVVKSERTGRQNPLSHTSRESVGSKKPSSSQSIQTQKKRLELKAAQAKARIEMELIDRKLAADLAELEEEYSPPSETSEQNNGAGDIEKWLERSQQELQQLDSDKHKSHTNPANTEVGAVQQLASAIKELVTSSAIQQNTKLISRLSTPKELPSFSGDPKEWLHFEQAYMESTEICNFTDKENLWRLRKCLRGAAQEAVAGLLISGASSADVISTLKLQFGNVDVILSRIVSDIKKMNNLSTDYHREIVPFSVKIKNYVAAVRALGRHEYLQGMEVANIILYKLPTTLLAKWTDYSYPFITAESPKPRLNMLSDFLTEEAVKISTCSATLLQPKTDNFKRKVNNIQTVLVQDGKSEEKCRYCRTASHKLTECKKFKKSLRKDRWLHVKRNGICYKCLLAHHRRDTCTAPSCDVNNCGQSHHRLLHYVPRQDNSESVPAAAVQPEVPPDTEVTSETITNINVSCSVMLKIVPINIQGPNGSVSTTALLDDGSTVSLVSASLAEKVGLRGRRECLRVCGAWNDTELVCNAQRAQVTLCGVDNKIFTIDARIVKELNLPQSLSTVNAENYTHLCDVSHHLCRKTQLQPQVLIGQDNCHLLLPLEMRVGRPDEPCATRTPLGWCLHGRVPNVYLPDSSIRHSSLFVTSDVMETECVLREIQEEVRRSFSIESMGVSGKPRQNSEDLHAVESLERTSVLINGQWHVGLPWRDEKCVMSDSYPTALCRLKGVELKLKRSKEYAKRYEERIRHLFDNDYAKRCNNINVTPPRTWYLPHFGVDNPNKKKLRLVFDAAAKTKGLSLNDYLLKGPDLLMSLFGIMLRFRENRVAVSGDIKDMFLRVKIRPEDQDAFRFLYREEPEGPINTYVMTSLIFGANCSPFIAQFVKNKNAKQYESSMPAAASAIYKSHYMDDYIDSLPNEETAIQLIHDVRSIHQKGGFEMRNWTSNSKQVLASLPKDLLGEAAVKFKIGQQYEGERTLGLMWHPSDDTLRFDVSFKRIPESIINGTQKPTKREMLRVIMSIFDVYGILAPYTINGKIILQETWKLKISWDEYISDTMFEKWSKWICLLKSLQDVSLPRHYPAATGVSEKKNKIPPPSTSSATATTATKIATNVADATSATSATTHSCCNINNRKIVTQNSYRHLQMHVFCDASSKAYCAVAYWRWNDDKNNTRVAFIASKCRVVGNKPITIPRLELQAAVLAARLADSLVREHTIKPEQRIFWSDSTTVLHWIRNDARDYKVYVANRLGEIDELTQMNEWRYVPTKLNVADIATRENYICPILQDEWMYGPTFLRCEEDEWPHDVISVERKETLLECINLIRIDAQEINLPVPDATRFSSWLRLRRSASLVLKFINKCKKLTCEFDDTMKKAEILLLKKSQAESFSKELTEIKNNRCVPKSSNILTLSPYLDEHGVMHVGGRIGAAPGILPETKNPVILDGRSYVARLIVKYYHYYYAHGNQETVVNEVKQRYWITRLRPTVKHVTSKCLTCRIRKSKPEVPRMGDLPGARMAHHERPFTYCGVDLFGPLEVTVGRRREKRYGVLFTCLTVRAIHLEVVTNLTTDSFIMALRRMAARRGWPQYLYSDNGTNLRGADTELKKAIKELDEEVLKDEALNRGTKWTFIPPASPHWGGAWERLIRSVKTSLKIILKERAPRDETLNTLLTEVENMVNSRPLTHVSVNPNDPKTLTPNHFLLGSSCGLPHIGKFDDSDVYLRKQWRISQRLADMYWRRWVKEVLPDLLPRKTWQEEHKNLQVGDIVLIVDPNSPRNCWPKEIIQEVIPGKDDRVRMIRIKTKSGMLTRPVTRVARIPVDGECCLSSTEVGRVSDALNNNNKIINCKRECAGSERVSES